MKSALTHDTDPLEDAPHAQPPTNPDPNTPLYKRVWWRFIHMLDKNWHFFALIALALAIFVSVLHIISLVTMLDTKSSVDDLTVIARTHLNATLELAKFFQISHIVDDMHTKDVQCLTLVAECEDLSISGLDAGAMAQMRRICANVVDRCERMVRNHLEQLAALTFDAGACVEIGPASDRFCYPEVQVTSTDTLHGIRYDRVGPASATFGSIGAPAEQSMLNRQEYGLYAAYSFYGAPGSTGMRDGVGYVSLNTSSPAFGRASVLLETPGRGWVHSFYVDHHRVVALGLNSNEVYSWDISTSLALATPGATVTGAAIASATASAAGALARPWSVRRLAGGDYIVSMLDNSGATCAANAQLCGGLMRLSSAALVPSRFDVVTDPLVATRHTPGDCAVLDGGRDMVACGAFGSYDRVLTPNCLNPDDIFGNASWGAQVNVYADAGTLIQQIDLAPFALPDLAPVYSPRPVADWQAVGGYIPNRIVQYHHTSDRFIVVDTFGGAIVGMVWTGTDPANVWSAAAVAWVLPLHGNPADLGDATAYTSPLVTDAVLSPDDCMLYLASPTLGQVRAYSLCAGDASGLGRVAPVLCAAHQLTAGVSDTPGTYTHASAPSRPLYGGPANLAVSPGGDFLYASSSSVFDDCLFPDAIAAGGFIVRYSVSSQQCSALALDIDSGFFVDGNALPGRAGVPARIGTIAFASGDARFQQPDTNHGY